MRRRAAMAAPPVAEGSVGGQATATVAGGGAVDAAGERERERRRRAEQQEAEQSSYPAAPPPPRLPRGHGCLSFCCEFEIDRSVFIQPRTNKRTHASASDLARRHRSLHVISTSQYSHAQPHTYTPNKQGTTAFPAAAHRESSRRLFFLPLLLLLLASTSGLAFHPHLRRPRSSTRLTTTMSESSSAAATTAATSAAPGHPPHALPVAPKHPPLGKGKGGDKKFTLGFLGGGMMASALIRGLVKAEVRARRDGGFVCVVLDVFDDGACRGFYR